MFVEEINIQPNIGEIDDQYIYDPHANKPLHLSSEMDSDIIEDDLVNLDFNSISAMQLNALTRIKQENVGNSTFVSSPTAKFNNTANAIFETYYLTKIRHFLTQCS